MSLFGYIDEDEIEYWRKSREADRKAQEELAGRNYAQPSRYDAPTPAPDPWRSAQSSDRWVGTGFPPSPSPSPAPSLTPGAEYVPFAEMQPAEQPQGIWPNWQEDIGQALRPLGRQILPPAMEAGPSGAIGPYYEEAPNPILEAAKNLYQWQRPTPQTPSQPPPQLAERMAEQQREAEEEARRRQDEAERYDRLAQMTAEKRAANQAAAMEALGTVQEVTEATTEPLAGPAFRGETTSPMLTPAGLAESALRGGWKLAQDAAQGGPEQVYRSAVERWATTPEPVPGAKLLAENITPVGLAMNILDPTNLSDAARLAKAGVKAVPKAARVVGEAAQAAGPLAKEFVLAGERGALEIGQEAAEASGPFYSQLGRALENPKLPNKASAQQMLGTLKGKELNVKDAELQETGLKALLDEKAASKQPVTRQELQEAFLEGQVKVEEVVKGGTPQHKFGSPEEQAAATQRVERAREGLAAFPIQTPFDDPAYAAARREYTESQAAMRDIVPGWGRAPESEQAPTKFSQYQLPGAEEGSYRELLMTLPDTTGERVRTINQRLVEISNRPANEITPALRAEHEALTAQRAKVMGERGQVYQSPHWQEPNVLAHLRFNDRIIDGKKTMLLEEFQSDLTQRVAKLEGLVKRGKASQSQADELARLKQIPLADRTPQLMMKRAINWAAANGYDRISWTTGKQQVDRWTNALRKNVDRIEWTRGADDQVRVTGSLKGQATFDETVPLYGEIRLHGQQVDLEDIAGKKIANDIRDATEMKGAVTGDGLTIGGEGLMKRYDEVMRNVANDLGRKHGARVSTSKVGIGGGRPTQYSDFDAYMKAKTEPMETVHSLDLTPSLITEARKGFPLFSSPELGAGLVSAATAFDPDKTIEENAQAMALRGLGGAAAMGAARQLLGRGIRPGLTIEDVSKGIGKADEAADAAKAVPMPKAAPDAYEAARAYDDDPAKQKAAQEAMRGEAKQRLAQATPEQRAAYEREFGTSEALTRARGTVEQAAELRPPEEGFAGNIRLEKFPEDIRDAIKAVVDEQNQFAGQRRGVITDEEALRNAAETALDTSIEDWLKTKPGRSFSQEEAIALGQTVAKARQDYDALQVTVAAARSEGTVTPAMEARLAEQALQWAALVGVRSGAAAEAGRSLRAFRQALTGENASREKAIQQAFSVLGGTERFTKWLDEFNQIDPSNTAARYKMLQSLHDSTLWDKLTAWRYASMLSSWKTHSVNFISNAQEAMDRPTTLLLAGYGREARADVYGMLRGVPEGVRAAGDAFSTGVSQFNVSQMETVRPRALGSGKFGRAVTAGSDALMAADDFWKSVNYSGVMHAEAYRLAKGNVAEAEKLLREPTAAMVKRAEEAAKIATFQNNPNELVRRIIGVANTPGAPGFAVRLVLPFIRTPANIYIRGLNMVMSPVLGPAKIAIKAAKGDMRAARLEAAKTIKAMGALAGLYGMAQSGMLSGQGPSDPAKRRVLEESGWQANSINIGGRWLNYSNLGPLSVPMAFVAAVKEGMDEGQRPNRQMAADVGQRVYNSMLDVSFLRGLSDLLRAESIENWVAQNAASIAGSFVPYGAGLAAAERVIDPTLRARDNPASAVQGRLPLVSQLLPSEPSIYGGTRQTTPNDTIAQILLPWQSSVPRQDPVANEVARLNQSPETRQAGVAVSVRQFKDQYAGAKQTPEQKRLLQSEAGQMAATYIAETISRPDYQQLSDVQKAQMLNKMLGTAYDLADLQLGERVSRDERHQALLAWANVPHYLSVKGTAPEIRRQNYEISQAKAKLAEYKRVYGRDMGEIRLLKDDKNAWKLAQREDLPKEILDIKKRRIDKAFGGVLLSQPDPDLVGAGNTLVPVGGR